MILSFFWLFCWDHKMAITTLRFIPHNRAPIGKERVFSPHPWFPLPFVFLSPFPCSLSPFLSPPLSQFCSPLFPFSLSFSPFSVSLSFIEDKNLSQKRPKDLPYFSLTRTKSCAVLRRITSQCLGGYHFGLDPSWPLSCI